MESKAPSTATIASIASTVNQRGAPRSPPRASRASRGLYRGENQSATDLQDLRGFDNSPEESPIIRVCPGQSVLDFFRLFRQRPQFAQQPLHLLGGVVVREANPHHPSALLHA